MFFSFAISIRLEIVLFSETFDGWITRLNLWSEILPERELLVGYRDCRKQRGTLFSWSDVSPDVLIDRTKLRNSSFCLGQCPCLCDFVLIVFLIDRKGCSQPASISNGVSRHFDYTIGSSVEYQCYYAHEMLGLSRSFCMVSSEWFPPPPLCRCSFLFRLKIAPNFFLI